MESTSDVEKFDFYLFTRETLSLFLKDKFDLPPYKALQLFQWVYKRRVEDFSLMSNIAKEYREAFAKIFFFPTTGTKSRQISNDGTRKYLFVVEQNDAVESVMIKQTNRMTLCVSSQVGCGMGCKFCRTATMGLKRHLSSSEIIRQVLSVVDDAKNFDDMFTNIVFMGMGEPLHNLSAIRDAINVLTDVHGLGMGPRKITVSTVGLVPKIKEFGESVSASLAVSLNATTDEVRNNIMPVNNKYPIAELLETLRNYPTGKRKKITIEYVMLSGVNDTEEDLKRLPKLLRGIQAKVNLIPYNENAGLGFKSPEKDYVHYWQNMLNKKGVEATVRWSKGQDINAACGQLATQSKKRKILKEIETNTESIQIA